ncbi:MAG: hypothetical protein M3081_22855 [Gemmatimonadota bacterium]|nr:hypothetical protein [Gemmatimonadota bacterium]
MILLAPAVVAQSTASAGTTTVRVTVLDNSSAKPIRDVLVSLSRTAGSAALTDSMGVAVVGPALARPDTLVLRRIGYRERSIPLDLAEAENSATTVALARVTVLDSVVSTEVRWTHAEEFEERRRTGNGVFYDRFDIDRLAPGSLNDLVRSSRGFHTIQGSFGSRVRSGRSSSGIDCSLVVFINGAPVTNDAARARGANNPAVNPLTVLDNIPIGMVQAVELYGSSEVPSEYKRGNSGCGAILVWMRSER